MDRDDPVVKLLPEAPIGSRITVRHLLTHTSGIDGGLFTGTGSGTSLCWSTSSSSSSQARQDLTVAPQRGSGWSGHGECGRPARAKLQPTEGDHFVVCYSPEHPWNPLTFTPTHLFASGRVTPRR